MQQPIPLKTYNVNNIHLEITGKCNLSCRYCYNSQFNNKEKIAEEMNTKNVKKLISEATEMGCKRFTFSGGDPFLRDDFFEILEYCKDITVDILTNAKILTQDLIDKLEKYPQINEIKISLDGFEGHDAIRTGSHYKDVIISIDTLKTKGIRVVINTEVTQMNLSEMHRLYNVLKELKVNRWRVDLPFILGRYKENYNEYKHPDFVDFINVFKEILVDYIAHKPTFELELFNIYKSELTPDNAITFDSSTHPCAYRKGSFPLRPNGDMVFCPSMDVDMSNYLKSGCLRKAIEYKYKHPFYTLKFQTSRVVRAVDF
jgi:MoaA/NifB/PqqE/SkfB family radical SAM enzyme